MLAAWATAATQLMVQRYCIKKRHRSLLLKAAKAARGASGAVLLVWCSQAYVAVWACRCVQPSIHQGVRPSRSDSGSSGARSRAQEEDTAAAAPLAPW